MAFYKNRYANPQKSNHTQQGFQNLTPFHLPNRNQLIRWSLNRFLQRQPKAPKLGYQHFIDCWQQPINWQVEGNQVWWLGHATLLWRLGTNHILTDPIFSKRASPFLLLAPKRKTNVACTIAELPPINAIVISHDHYDHFDIPSIKTLLARFPEIRFFVPLGLKRPLQLLGAQYIHELDWKEQIDFNDISFHFVPAQHWGQRTLFDRYQTLWGGWVFQHDNHHYYFAGDTGYHASLFQQIQQQFSPIEIAAIPIGAYAPRKIMYYQHMDPLQALMATKQLACRQAIGIHWATFELADEPLDEPAEQIMDYLTTSEWQHIPFHLLKIGGNLAIK